MNKRIAPILLRFGGAKKSSFEMNKEELKTNGHVSDESN